MGDDGGNWRNFLFLLTDFFSCVSAKRASFPSWDQSERFHPLFACKVYGAESSGGFEKHKHMMSLRLRQMPPPPSLLQLSSRMPDCVVPMLGCVFAPLMNGGNECVRVCVCAEQ